MFLVLEYEKNNDIRHIRYLFREKFGRNRPVPGRMLIPRLHRKFKTEGTVHRIERKIEGGYKVDQKRETAQQISDYFKDRPTASVRSASRALGVKKTSLHRVLRKKLNVRPYKIQSLHHLKPSDPAKRVSFAKDMLEISCDVTDKIFFSDESTFSLCGTVNTQNCRIWGSERPADATIEKNRNSPKVNVFCALNGSMVIGPYFFPNNTVNGNDYIEMLMWLLPQLHGDPLPIFQQDGAPPHWKRETRALLNERLPGRWIGRASERDDCLLHWPPRSPDITPLDFFLWGYIKDSVFSFPLPVSIDEMKDRIVRAVEDISPDLLKKVHACFRKRLQLLIKRKGAHIEKY